jgi:cellulose biosynthesis protein BcsQ
MSAKPGAGATTISQALTAAHTKHGLTVTQIDPTGDLTHHTIDYQQALPLTPTILTPEQLATLRGRRRDQPTYHLGCATHSTPADWLPLAIQAQRDTDVVIVDTTPTSFDELTAPLLLAEAWALVITEPTLVAEHHLTVTLDRLTRLGVLKDRILVGVNKHPKPPTTVDSNLLTATSVGYATFDPNIPTLTDRLDLLTDQGGLTPLVGQVMWHVHGIEPDTPSRRPWRRR